MRRLRKTGALDQDGNLVTIPRLPSAEKVEHLLGMSLDRMRDHLSWSLGLDPYPLAAQAQVIRVVAMRCNIASRCAFSRAFSTPTLAVTRRASEADAARSNSGTDRALAISARYPLPEASAQMATSRSRTRAGC
jgi:hypothetical protein